jgi:cyclohexanone monooxygenase
MGSTPKRDYEAIVVGTGFAGLHALYQLKQVGLDVFCVEAGSDVGGTWHWNTYPGARSDVEAFVYCFSFDKDLLQSFPWRHNYFMQPELQAYFQEVARKHELYPLIQVSLHNKSSIFSRMYRLIHGSSMQTFEKHTGMKLGKYGRLR